MDDPAEQPSANVILARGWAGGAIGGAPIGWALLCGLAGRGLWLGTLLVTAIVGGLVGAVIGSLVGLLSGAVLAAREHRPRSDRNQRVVAATTSAAPFALLALIVSPATAGGWLGWLAVAALSAGAGAALAPCVVHGWARATWG